MSTSQCVKAKHALKCVTRINIRKIISSSYTMLIAKDFLYEVSRFFKSAIWKWKILLPISFWRNARPNSQKAFVCSFFFFTNAHCYVELTTDGDFIFTRKQRRKRIKKWNYAFDYSRIKYQLSWARPLRIGDEVHLILSSSKRGS